MKSATAYESLMPMGSSPSLSTPPYAVSPVVSPRADRKEAEEDDVMVLVEAKEEEEKEEKKRESGPPPEQMREIIMKQKASGSWEWSDAERIVGLTSEKLRSGIPLAKLQTGAPVLACVRVRVRVSV
jgi:hypothetical protein